MFHIGIDIDGTATQFCRGAGKARLEFKVIRIQVIRAPAPGQDIGIALTEGVVSVLTEIAWSDDLPRVSDPVSRAAIRGEPACELSPRPDPVPRLAYDRYVSMAEPDVTSKIGFVEDSWRENGQLPRTFIPIPAVIRQSLGIGGRTVFPTDRTAGRFTHIFQALKPVAVTFSEGRSGLADTRAALARRRCRRARPANSSYRAALRSHRTCRASAR